MSVNITPSLQLAIVDPAATLTPNPLEAGLIALFCANGAVTQEATLPPATASLPLSFPVGVTTAVVIFIASVTCTDLIVKVGSGSPVSLSVPLGQGIFLYSMTSAQISLNSVLGGKIQYSVGG